MSIKEAREYIEQTVLLYLKKDEFGDYRIPVVRQRPIFLLGAPGIGKTAIMEQVASHLQIALVSYSMTHHTRQSALGLPFISKKVYDGKEMDVSEYTMSEIIASVYETMEKSGKKEGILFLDEINCVSETLSPSMLQFLQYKVFGRHQVPDGWVVVTAGNPPEYNRSVKEFDIVTMDRLKLLEVEPDYAAFREYGVDKGLHNAILSFLELKKEFFYKIGTTAEGRSYVTARGWEDLSEILYLYEEEGLKVNDTLIGQYLRNDKIVREFSAYYELYNKYKRDYAIENILSGEVNDVIIKKCEKASFDEKLSLISMLLDSIIYDMNSCMDDTFVMEKLFGFMKHIQTMDTDGALTYTDNQIQVHRDLITSLMTASALSEKERIIQKKQIVFLEKIKQEYLSKNEFSGAKAVFDEKVKALKESTAATAASLKNMFDFVEKAFSDGNEMLIVVTTLTASKAAAAFIGKFGSPEYKKHAGELMVEDSLSKVMDEINDLQI